MFSEVDLNLVITSNVDYPVQVNLLSNPYNLLDTSNSKTEYRWDLTAFTFGTENQVTIEYKPNGAATYATYSGQFTPQSLQAVVTVLNGLGIGFFSLYTSGGNTYIGTYNDNYTFGNLNIFSSGVINFGTGFNAPLNSVATQTDGKIVCVGGFTQYNGTSISGWVCRINTDGTLDTTFNIGGAGFNSPPAVVIQLKSNDELLFAGGAFNTYNGNVVPFNIVKINSTGTTPDATFLTNAGIGFNLSSIPYRNCLLQQLDGKILIVGGNMITYNLTSIGGMCRINPDGVLDPLFEPNNSAIATFSGIGFSGILSVCVNDTNGKIYVTGDFDQYNDSGGVHLCNGIAALTSTGLYDATFIIGIGLGFTGSPVADSVVQTDGKIVMVGAGIYNGTPFTLLRLNTNGTVDTTGLGTSFNGILFYVYLLSSGNLLISGNFTSYNTTAAGGIILLNSDMTINTSSSAFGIGFQPLGVSSTYNSKNTSSTTINLGGNFTSFNGTTQNYITQISI
jgi:uncharacterized delta-60 repeat protein